MHWRLIVLAVALAACSPKHADEAALLNGAEALGWGGKYTVAGHSFRDLPATVGAWQVAPAGNLVAFIPRRAFEELTDLPAAVRARRPAGDVIINIGDASRPADVFWRGPRPGDEAGEYEGLKRYVIRGPGMARLGDTLILPAPYKGRIHCPAGALGEDPAPSCLAMLEADGLRHSFSILPEQVPAWRAQVDAYLAFISKIEA